MYLLAICVCPQQSKVRDVCFRWKRNGREQPRQGAEVLAVPKKVEAMSPEPQIHGALRYGAFLPTIDQGCKSMSGGIIAINRKRSECDRDYFDYWKRLSRLIEIRPIMESGIAIIPYDYSIIAPRTKRLIDNYYLSKFLIPF
jgi:hypothetical protein